MADKDRRYQAILVKNSKKHVRGKNWTVEEDSKLMDVMDVLGNKWPEIVALEPFKGNNRSATALQCRIWSIMEKQAGKNTKR